MSKGLQIGLIIIGIIALFIALSAFNKSQKAKQQKQQKQTQKEQEQTNGVGFIRFFSSLFGNNDSTNTDISNITGASEDEAIAELEASGGTVWN